MVHFFGVTSLLLFLHIALVAADGVTPVPAARTNNIVTRLLGRASKCLSGNYSEPYDSTQPALVFILCTVPCEDHGCCKAGYHCCNDKYDKCKSLLQWQITYCVIYNGFHPGCPNGQTCGKINGQTWCLS